MTFPIQFVKPSGSYDFVSPVINFTGNVAAVGFGSAGIGTITYLSLKALGFDEIATSPVVAIPVFLGELGIAGTVIGGGLITAMVYGVSRAIGSSR